MNEIVFIIVEGFLIALMLLGLFFALAYFWRHKIALWIAKKQINKTMELLTKNTDQIDLIKDLKENKLTNPLIIQKAKEKLRNEVKQNGNIQQETRTTTEPTRERTETNAPRDSSVSKQRNISTKTFSRTNADKRSNT